MMCNVEFKMSNKMFPCPAKAALPRLPYIVALPLVHCTDDIANLIKKITSLQTKLFLDFRFCSKRW